jgi:hypothetical protein
MTLKAQGDINIIMRDSGHPFKKSNKIGRWISFIA